MNKAKAPKPSKAAASPSPKVKLTKPGDPEFQPWISRVLQQAKKSTPTSPTKAKT
jgi:hypothetical protein